MTVVTTFYVMSSGVMFAVAIMIMLLLLSSKLRPSKIHAAKYWLVMTALLAGSLQYVHFLAYQESDLSTAYFYSSLKNQLAIWLSFTVTGMVTFMTQKLRSKTGLLIFLCYTTGMSLLGFLGDIPIRYDSPPTIIAQELAWGETILRLNAPMSIIGLIRDSVFLLVHLWVISSLLMYAIENRERAMSFFIWFSFIVTLFFINDISVLLFDLPSIILSLSGYVLLICFFGHYIFYGYFKMQSELHELAYNDAITKTPNRASVQRDFDTLIKNSSTSIPLSVCVVDLDHFSIFNNAFGHDIGNQILAKVGQQILSITDNRSVLTSRFDKDRFVIIDTNKRTSTSLYELADNLHKQLKQTIHIDERLIELSCTIGLVQIDSSELNQSQDIFGIAERAIAHAKQVGKGHTAFYSDSARDDSLHMLQMKQALKEAIAHDDIYVVFQPQFTNKGALYGAEVLVRWQDKTGRFVPPPEFIHIAESFGLIHELGALVQRKTAMLLSPFKSFLIENNIRVSINVSAWEFTRSTFVEDTVSVFEAYDLPTRLFTLEITETVLIHDLQESKVQLKKIQEQGFQVALDDFGTGYSSLSYLRELPFDVLKIDKAFVDDLSAQGQQSMIAGIINIAQAVNLSTVAEGVETSEQADKLVAEGVNVLQGYHFAKPMQFEDFAKLYLR